MEIKAKNGQRFVLAKIQAKKEGEGKVAGRMMSVKLLFSAYNAETKKEELISEWVSFWNGDKTSQPQLYTRISSIPVGEWIVCKLQPRKEAGRNTSALEFITKDGGVLTTSNIEESNEINVFVGITHSSSAIKTANGKTVFNANLKVAGVWRQISFWASEKQPGLPGTVEKICSNQAPVVFVTGKATKFKDAFTYTGFKAERYPKSECTEEAREPETKDPADAVIPDTIPDDPEPDVMITIGIYGVNPRKLAEFTSADDRGYLATVLRYYKPVSEAESDQLSAIKAFLG